ncbi:MAG: hypothetical protein KatS3mg059_0913 [Thermomicrobiales bacterium]|nr:MAG: hypothetical protein KatS3mg059_0913 [Thermomicrobiales bacterium]
MILCDSDGGATSPSSRSLPCNVAATYNSRSSLGTQGSQAMHPGAFMERRFVSAVAFPEQDDATPAWWFIFRGSEDRDRSRQADEHCGGQCRSCRSRA